MLATGRVIVGSAAASLATIAFADHVIAQRLQTLRSRGQLVLDTVELDSLLAFLGDLPHGLQRLLEERDRFIDAI
jgi:hypothetical protein